MIFTIDYKEGYDLFFIAGLTWPGIAQEKLFFVLFLSFGLYLSAREA